MENPIEKHSEDMGTLRSLLNKLQEYVLTKITFLITGKFTRKTFINFTQSNHSIESVYQKIGSKTVIKRE
jgi:hypothetical protein